MSWSTHQERHKYQTDSSSKENGAQRRNIPWNVRVLTSPTQPENPDNQKGTTYHSTKESIFGRRKSSPLLDKFRIPAGSKIADDRADGCSSSNTDEYEAVLGNCEAAFFNKDNWKCLKYW